MRIVPFVKMVAAGNDFVLIEEPLAIRDKAAFARKLCDRRFGVGADGVLLVGKSRVAQVRMRIINADGTEAEMCGNGARCVAHYVTEQLLPSPLARQDARTSRAVTIQTRAGIVDAVVASGSVKIRLTTPVGLKLAIPLLVGDRPLRVHAINTGVPHVGVFVQGLTRINVDYLGRYIRFHPRFAPKGTNVNFIEAVDSHTIKVRTYERGVESETLACGTGSSASAVLFSVIVHPRACGTQHIAVHTRSGEVLSIHFQKRGKRIRDLWLEGQAARVAEGVYYV